MILPLVNRKGIKFIPIDSEHSAMFQILNKFGKLNMKRAIITASGGPFFKREDLSEIKVTDALNHPTWDMGAKITIDSATLMNKGFEVIDQLKERLSLSASLEPPPSSITVSSTKSVVSNLIFLPVLTRLYSKNTLTKSRLFEWM